MKKRAICSLISFLIFCFSNSYVMAASTNTQYDISGSSLEISDSDGDYTVVGSTQTNNIVVNGGTHTITLNNATIDCKSAEKPGIELKNDANVNVILVGQNKIVGGGSYETQDSYAGIQVPLNTTLTLKGDGSLDVSSTWKAAAIGGSNNMSVGTINIQSGIINAAGASSSAGIGGGCNGVNGTINIRGGTIVAKGNKGAGIGGGLYGAGGNINITGGEIKTENSSSGAGIGGGYEASSGNIMISGGNIYAQGSNNGGAGIGGGGHGNCDTVIITGGIIYAEGSSSGIGGGYHGNGGTVEISGGTVTADGCYGAGIGGGGFGGNGGSVIITGGNVWAKSYLSESIGHGTESTVSGTLTDDIGNTVYLTEITLTDANMYTAVSSIGIDDYVLRDMRTIRAEYKQKLFLYLPEGKTLSKISAGENNYYYEHGTFQTTASNSSVIFNPFKANVSPENMSFISGSFSSILIQCLSSVTQYTTYQWYSNDTNSNTGGTLLVGETGDRYSVRGDMEPGTYYYYCVAKHGTDTAVSSVIKIAVAQPFKATVTPDTMNLISGNVNNAQIQCVCNHTQDTTYQWYSNNINSNTGGKPLWGETRDKFSIPIHIKPGTYYYYCVANYGTETSTSEVSKIAVAEPFKATVTSDTMNLIFENINNAQIQCVCNYTKDTTYQWYSNDINSNTGGTSISGETGDKYSIPEDIKPGTYYYYCEANHGDETVTSVAVEVVVAEPFKATVTPDTLNLISGNINNAQIQCSSNYTKDTTYQWYSNDTNSNTGGTSISGETGDKYSIPEDIKPGTYYYYCVANHGTEAVTSAVVEVVVAESLTNLVSAEDISCDYDGEQHSITVNAPSDAVVTYSTVDSDTIFVDDTNPTFTEVGDYTVYYFAVRSDEVVKGSAHISINKLNQQAPNSLSSTATTFEDTSDGKIAGVNDTMEYKLSDADEYIAVEQGATELTGLASGTYDVRYKATNHYNASDVTEVIVAKGEKRTYILNLTDISFDTAVSGYEQPEAKELKIVSAGNSDCVISEIELSGNIFTLNKTDGATIKSGLTDDTTYTVKLNENISAGSYEETLTITYNNGKKVTAKVTIEVKTLPQVIQTEDGIDAVDLEQDELNSVFTKEEMQKAALLGYTPKLIVESRDCSSEISKATKEIMEADENNIALYVDISLFKVLGDKKEKLESTSQEWTVTLDIPKELQEEGKTFFILREHDGVISKLFDLDNDPSTITFKTDKFSTYAIAYEKAQVQEQEQAESLNPKTGDNSCPWLWAIILLMAAGGVVYCYKKAVTSFLDI